MHMKVLEIISYNFVILKRKIKLGSDEGLDRSHEVVNRICLPEAQSRTSMITNEAVKRGTGVRLSS